jgi:hypothetical protein
MTHKRTIPGFKDENGAFVPIAKEPGVPKPPASLPLDDVSLDEIAGRIITSLNRASRHLLENITAGSVDRETIGALKDIAAVLKDLRKEEKDILEQLTDEELDKMIRK